MMTSDSDDDDEALWRHVTRSLKKLSIRPVVTPPPSPRRVAPRVRAPEIIPPAWQQGAPLEPGVSVDIDRGNAEKLKRGKYPIEGRVDLHGYRREEAYIILRRFIENSYGQGKRCVLVVTGKGLKDDGSKGVIRSLTPVWLNEPEIRPYVLAFRYAKPKDGGEGALYVLLKRKSPRG